jgi:hypothetical protein
MINHAPSFAPALPGTRQRQIDSAKWDTTVDLYEQGQYRESIYSLLESIDSSMVQASHNGRSKFVIPHGSIILYLTIEEDNLSIVAPFLKMPMPTNIPLLRQVVELNFYPLNLAKITLERNELRFRYTEPLELCEPYKTYEVLKEICTYADAYDDELIKKFGATHLQAPRIQRFTHKQLITAWNKFHLYLKEALQYLNYFERARAHEFCLDIIDITLKKIDYYMSPQGVMRTDLERNISYLQSQEVQLADKIAKGKEYLKKLQSLNGTEFSKDLYKANVFIPFKTRGTYENIRSNFERYYNSARAEIDRKDFIGAVLTIESAFFSLFYYTQVPEDISRIVTNALVASNHQPWHQAASVLWRAMSEVMNPKVKKKSKGFFSSLLWDEQEQIQDKKTKKKPKGFFGALFGK